MSAPAVRPSTGRECRHQFVHRGAEADPRLSHWRGGTVVSPSGDPYLADVPVIVDAHHDLRAGGVLEPDDSRTHLVRFEGGQGTEDLRGVGAALDRADSRGGDRPRRHVCGIDCGGSMRWVSLSGREEDADDGATVLSVSAAPGEAHAASAKVTTTANITGAVRNRITESPSMGKLRRRRLPSNLSIAPMDEGAAVVTFG